MKTARLYECYSLLLVDNHHGYTLCALDSPKDLDIIK